MPNEDNKTIKYNQGEKFGVLIWSVCLKKQVLATIILRNHQQLK